MNKHRQKLLIIRQHHNYGVNVSTLGPKISRRDGDYQAKANMFRLYNAFGASIERSNSF